MDPRHLHIDERLGGDYCTYCGGEGPSTADHVPSRVLLDEPYPSDPPTVSACGDCNQRFSFDEQYVGCLIDCVVSGSAEPGDVSRKKVARILRENPSLASMLAASRRRGASGVTWEVDEDRVRNVVLKLARGHVAFELFPRHDEPTQVSFAPLVEMEEVQIRAFFAPTPSAGAGGWPEINSRAFRRAAGALPSPHDGWHVVQPGRYRYLVDGTDAAVVRMLLGEYLACEVDWG